MPSRRPGGAARLVHREIPLRKFYSLVDLGWIVFGSVFLTVSNANSDPNLQFLACPIEGGSLLSWTFYFSLICIVLGVVLVFYSGLVAKAYAVIGCADEARCMTDLCMGICGQALAFIVGFYMFAVNVYGARILIAVQDRMQSEDQRDPETYCVADIVKGSIASLALSMIFLFCLLLRSCFKCVRKGDVNKDLENAYDDDVELIKKYGLEDYFLPKSKK